MAKNNRSEGAAAQRPGPRDTDQRPAALGRPRHILIAGPTASGKSGLAMALAKRFGGTVVNADSMQLYRQLCVVTARPTEDDEAQVPHRLYGVLDAAVETASAVRWSGMVGDLLAGADRTPHPLVIVGGTGLYLRALIEGLSPIPAIPDAIRAHWRAAAEQEGAPALHAHLTATDPEMAGRLAPGDTQRIVRALEVVTATGRSLADWQRTRGTPLLPASDMLGLVVDRPRADLYARCDARFDAMLAAGALDEVAALRESPLPADHPLRRALGVAPLTDVLEGRCDMASAADRAKTDTRRYAKRQLTWLRGNMMSWTWGSPQQLESHAAVIFPEID